LFSCVEVLVSKDGTTWIPASENDTIGSSLWRLIRKGTVSYEGTDDVYLKIKCANHDKTNSQKILLLDVLITNAGEITNGIQGVKENTGSVVSTQYFDVSGAQLNHSTKGINIVKEKYSDGTTKVRKILVK
jgi:hypothetical protein